MRSCGRLDFVERGNPGKERVGIGEESGRDQEEEEQHRCVPEDGRPEQRVASAKQRRLRVVSHGSPKQARKRVPGSCTEGGSQRESGSAEIVS